MDRTLSTINNRVDQKKTKINMKISVALQIIETFCGGGGGGGDGEAVVACVAKCRLLTCKTIIRELNLKSEFLFHH